MEKMLQLHFMHKNLSGANNCGRRGFVKSNYYLMRDFCVRY